MKTMSLDGRAIAICATFTAEAIQPPLAFWAKKIGFDPQIRFAPYGQIFQQLLDPAGLFARNRSGFNVALVRFEDWPHDAEEHARKLVEAVRTAASASSSPLILVACPPTPRHEIGFECTKRILQEGIAGIAAVHFVAADEILSLYPVAEIHDQHADELGRVPYTPLFFAALATAIARKIHAISAPPFKVIALDCDDTLWAGICGEDGPQNVVVDAPRRKLQEFMAARRREGMLLALCSKNNEEDVVETFRAHPEMPLLLQDFAARSINWESKGTNLGSLAHELDLGLDTFMLVDDNAKECTEAQSAAPEILALALPPSAQDIPEFLRHVWAFDRARITEEDRRRAELYTQRAERTRAGRTAASLEDFLASLELTVRIAPLEPRQVARVAQLTQRTNQMNATCRRRSEAEIQALDGFECLTVEVNDRFGSYGLTGVIIFQHREDVLAVDTFLLSCRALGRGVEHQMIARLCEIARERSLSQVEIPFVPSQRNRPAGLFLESLTGAGPDGVYRLAAGFAPRLSSVPVEVGQASLPASSVPRRIDYLEIATRLRTPSAVLERIRADAQRSAPQHAAGDPPRTPLERDLGQLFAEVLDLPAAGIHHSFFDLGGHSLLAVQLLSRVRQVYGVELSLEVVYSGEFTVAELAKAVELKEIEQSGADYQDLLRELESLSDEEARALLAEEQDAS